MSLNPSVAPPPPEKRPIKSPGITLTTLAIALSGLGLVLLIGGTLTWFEGSFAECENNNIRPVPSPDGKLTAVLFRRDCGDPSKYTTHVSILPAGKELPDGTGNAFSAAGEPVVLVRWRDERNLVIESGDGTRVTFLASRVDDVRISNH